MTNDIALKVVVFDAGDGDCLLLDFLGRSGRYTILVDGGRTSTPLKLRTFLETFKDAPKVIDLFVVTHIDADHISGAISLARDTSLKDRIRAVWFNDSRHLPRGGAKPLSTAQGDTFASLVSTNGWEWNGHFGGAAVQRRVATSNRVPLSQETGLRLLGPDASALERLAASWPADELLRADEDASSPVGAIAMGDAEPPDVEGLASSRYEADPSVANASSISFVVEHRGVRVFVGADATPESLARSIQAEYGPDGLHVDIAVLPHHGSASNMSPELASLLTSDHWIVSTSGRRHGHPSPQAIARVLKNQTRGGRTFHFNSAHAQARLWNSAPIKSRYDYDTTYPGQNEAWISVEIESQDFPSDGKASGSAH